MIIKQDIYKHEQYLVSIVNYLKYLNSHAELKKEGKKLLQSVFNLEGVVSLEFCRIISSLAKKNRDILKFTQQTEEKI